MFKFAENDELDKNVTNEYIDEVEKKFNIKFPDILRKYFLIHNFSTNKECIFKIKGFEGQDTDFILDYIIPLKYGDISFEDEYKLILEDEQFPNEFIPLAYDMDTDMYYWNSKSGKVYYICHENAENPILICNSVDDFFDILNRSCEEKITIENLNISYNGISNKKKKDNKVRDILLIILFLVICLIGYVVSNFF